MPIRINEMPSIETINKYLNYCSETGVFTASKNHPFNKENSIIGLIDRTYIRIYIEKKYYAAHRIAWLLVNKQLNLKDQIDHIDGNGHNNKILNLRLATHANNCRNIGLPKHNKSGIKGVHFHKANKKWRSQIKLNGKRYWLGDFEKIEDAKNAYDKASKKLHGEFRRE